MRPATDQPDEDDETEPTPPEEVEIVAGPEPDAEPLEQPGEEEPPTEGTVDFVRRAHSGDPAALNALLARFRDRMVSTAQYRLGERLRAKVQPEDVVQEALKTAFARFDSFDPADAPAFGAWLLTILENRIRDEAKRWDTEMRSGVEVSIHGKSGAEGGSTMLPVASRITSPSVAARTKELQAAFVACLASVPEHYAEIILLRNMELGWAEIARRLDTNAKAAQMMHIRATLAIRVCLERKGFKRE